MKNILRVVISAVLICLLFSFVACDNGTQYLVPETIDPEVGIHPQGKIKATTYLRSGEDSEIAFDKWIKAYNEQFPDVQVKPEIIAWSDFGLKIAAGDIGDVYYGCEGNVYSYSQVNKAAMPLDGYIEYLDIDITNVFTGLYELGCANGYLYMVPADLSTAAYFVNKSLLTEKGVAMPDNTWTYEDFKYICSKVRTIEEDGSYSKVGFVLTTAFEQIVPFLTGWGGQWVDSVNKKINLASDEKVLQGLTELVNLIRDGYVCVSGLTGEVGAKFALINGPQNYAFTYGTYINRITMKETYDSLGLEMDAVCLPEYPRRTIYGGCTGFFVYSKTKNPDAAATFALYLLTDDGQRQFNSTLGGGVPTTKACYEDSYWRFPYDEDEFNYEAFIAYPEAFVGNWPEVYVPSELCAPLHNFSATWLTRHFNNVKDYRDTLKEVEETCNELWAGLFKED